MKKPDDQTQTTDFGFESVPFSEKTAKVTTIFHSVATHYDLMNDLMSLGVHRLWKNIAINLAHLRSGQTVLDLAGGTGDLTEKISSLVGETGQVVLADINESMLKVGQARLLDLGIFSNLSVVQADAEQLPFPDNYFDRALIGFGLRNVTRKDNALASLYRALKPGGRLLILEFSTPTLPGLKTIYDAYSFKLLPWLGKTIAKDETSYRYLVESIRKHPDQETLKNMMIEAGFENCDYHNLSGGIVAIHRGYKF